MAAVRSALSATECLHLERQRFLAAQAALPDEDLADASFWDSLDLSDAGDGHSQAPHELQVAEQQAPAAAQRSNTPVLGAHQTASSEAAPSESSGPQPAAPTVLVAAVSELLAQCEDVRIASRPHLACTRDCQTLHLAWTDPCQHT